jgi:hypothetical protein
LLPTTASLRRLRIAEELDHESLLALAQLWLDRANDAVATVDGDAVSRVERRVAVEVARCETTSGLRSAASLTATSPSVACSTTRGF